MLRLGLVVAFAVSVLSACDDGAAGGGAGSPGGGSGGGGDFDAAAGCTEDARQCNALDSAVEICRAGVWERLGPCPEGQTCRGGQCEGPACTPECGARTCGSDGCAGTCGECAPEHVCTLDGRCEPPAARCGDDACNGDEACDTCPADCGACCGNGECARDEACNTCPADCRCPDGEVCDPGTAACEACAPQCNGRECGPDGCGATCGACDDGVDCVNGLCAVVCRPDCDARACGSDGCGGECGECAGDDVCDAAGRCGPPPARCGDEACGDDEDCANCPADCGACCGNGECAQRENCATCPADCLCPEGEGCDARRQACVPMCVPQCGGRECGDDGCGNVCGQCAAGESCEGGLCIAMCMPMCEGRECGGDGCNGRCGQCDDGEICENGTCEPLCQPSCDGAVCGPDGCGGFCGACDPGEACVDGVCLANCQRECDGRECGSDGCGGACGECDAGDECNPDGVCEPACQRMCVGRACGDDGCGGVCGECAGEEMCDADGQCVPPVVFCNCRDDQVCLDGFCREPDEVCSDENPVGLCRSGEDCLAGRCTPRGAACAQANPTGICPQGEICRDGECRAIDVAALCDDRNACTVDAFDHVRNQCVSRAAAAMCSDGNGCTADRCVDGACVSAPIADCIEPPTLDPYVTPTNEPMLTLAGTKPAGASVRINDQEAVAESPEVRWQVRLNLAPGENVFRVQSRDRGRDSAVVEARIVYDNVAPTIEVSPAGGVFLNPVTITATSDEPADVYYTDDGGTPDEWSRSFRSVKEFRIIDDTVLRFRARDLAGNWQDGETEVRFEITGHGNRWRTGGELPEPLTLTGAAEINGVIYVVGGTDGLAAQAGVLRFDPASGAWSDEAALPQARAQLAAVSHGGFVYALGGEDDGRPFNAVTRMRPGAAWEARRPMPTTRFGLAAAVLGDRIYAFGGKTNGGVVLPNVETYNPASDTWANDAAPMPRARYGHAAIAHGDRIYVVGGEDEAGTPVAELDIYIPSGNRWEAGPALPTPRSFATVTLNRNLGAVSGGYTGFVVAGGRRVGGAPTPIVEEFVIEDGAWRERTPLDRPRHSGAGVATVQDGTVDDQEVRGWVVGGLRGADLTADLSYYVQDQDFVRHLAPMPETRFMHSAQPLNGLVYVFGGRSFQETRSFWAFDPETGRYDDLPDLPGFQNGLGSVVLGGHLYAVGGADNFGNAVPHLRRYDVATRRWEDLRPMQSARRDAAVVAHGGLIYAIGGENGGALQTVEIYDPATNRWNAGPVLPVGRRGARALAHDGEILLVGGLDDGGQVIGAVLRFAQNQWSPRGLDVPVAYANAVLIHDHQLNVLGGRDANGITNRVWSINLATNVVTRPLTGGNLVTGVEHAALAYHHGKIYLLGGTTGARPEGDGLVQKIDGRCFNGFRDHREIAEGARAFDHGGTCPSQRPCGGQLYGGVCLLHLSESCVPNGTEARAYCQQRGGRLMTHAEYVRITQNGWAAPDANYHTIAVDQVAGCANRVGNVNAPNFGNVNGVWSCDNPASYCRRAVICSE